MPLNSQFSLSLELTKLIPFGPLMSKTYEAAMNLSRSLQNSGSDFVTEEDLVGILGKCFIDAKLASSFKTIVGKSTSNHQLHQSLSLVSGPGPTISRAFGRDAAPYLAMAIQCSFLMSIHKIPSLAAALADVFERQGMEAPPNYNIPASPTQSAIRGTLTAIIDQTEAFKWEHMLQAVGSSLAEINGLFKWDMAIQPHIFRGAILMFPLVQRFPEEHMVQIQTHDHQDPGICALVVWAHHILGLTVSISSHLRPEVEGMRETIRFGLESVHVQVHIAVIDDPHMQTSITLMSASPKSAGESLFNIEPDPGESVIDSSYTVSAHGYAMKKLEDTWDAGSKSKEGIGAALSELSLISCGLATHLAKHLYMTPILDTDNNLSKDMFYQSQKFKNCLVPFRYSEKNILKSAALLFDIPDFQAKEVEQYAAVIPSFDCAPLTIQVALRQSGRAKNLWSELYSAASFFSVLILAFSQVRDLEACKNLPLLWLTDGLDEIPLLNAHATWDGHCNLAVAPNTWLKVIAGLLDCDFDNTKSGAQDSVALISRRGWSVYVNTFGDMDPSSVDESLVISRGVPFRNGIYKHHIVDAANGRGHIDVMRTVEKAGEKAKIRCAYPLTFLPPMVGDHEDSFIVALRAIKVDRPDTDPSKTGYRELSDSLWAVHKTSPCSHVKIKGGEFVVPKGGATIQGYDELSSGVMMEELRTIRIYICLTSNSKASRWRMLVSLCQRGGRPSFVNGNMAGNGGLGSPVILRGPNCCAQCAVEQTCARPGKWFLIL